MTDQQILDEVLRLLQTDPRTSSVQWLAGQYSPAQPSQYPWGLVCEPEDGATVDRSVRAFPETVTDRLQVRVEWFARSETLGQAERDARDIREKVRAVLWESRDIGPATLLVQLAGGLNSMPEEAPPAARGWLVLTYERY
jgi:hypothetical protein